MTTTQVDLFSALQLGDLSLKNRVAMAPMTRGRGDENRCATPVMGDYYAQRAGVGLIITEATAISSQGYGWMGAPAIYTEAMAESWKPVVDQVHEAGGVIYLQLWHMGRASHSSFHHGELPVAPSAVKIEGDQIHTPDGKKDYEVPRALETEEIPGIVADYVQGAKFAKQAGFDGVEIHAANGYLLDQFLQSKTNHREDQYGGDVAGRFLILREIVEAVSTVYDPSRMGVRLSPNGLFNDMGSPDYVETYVYAASELNTLNIGYLHVMDGLAFGFHEKGEPMTLAQFREVYQGMLIGNCGYEMSVANDAIKAGDADMIAIGRPLITNPDLVERYRNDWPLAPFDDMSQWYGGGAEGYSDYPNYQA